MRNSDLYVGGLSGVFCVPCKGKRCAFFCGAFFWRLPSFFTKVLSFLAFLSKGFQERFLTTGRGMRGRYFGAEMTLSLRPVPDGKNSLRLRLRFSKPCKP